MVVTRLVVAGVWCMISTRRGSVRVEQEDFLCLRGRIWVIGYYDIEVSRYIIQIIPKLFLSLIELTRTNKYDYSYFSWHGFLNKQ